MQQQNRELLQALDDLRARQAEVERLNAELAETNRGVLALYAELDDKAESLRRASEHKSRFLSDMSHELRTPLNAMISLSRLLLDRADGDLTPEQEKQVALIHQSATSLGEMVNDLLDLAKIEAGKTDLSTSRSSRSPTCSRPCGACSGRCWRRGGAAASSTSRPGRSSCTATRASCRRSCATSSPTP